MALMCMKLAFKIVIEGVQTYVFAFVYSMLTFSLTAYVTLDTFTSSLPLWSLLFPC